MAFFSPLITLISTQYFVVMAEQHIMCNTCVIELHQTLMVMIFNKERQMRDLYNRM